MIQISILVAMCQWGAKQRPGYHLRREHDDHGILGQFTLRNPGNGGNCPVNTWKKSSAMIVCRRLYDTLWIQPCLLKGSGGYDDWGVRLRTFLDSGLAG